MGYRPSGGITVDERDGSGWPRRLASASAPGRRRPRSTRSLPKVLDKEGNPVYDWNAAVRIVGDQAGPSEPSASRKGMISNGNSWTFRQDGMVYWLANTKSKSGTPQEGGMHMGGNVLMGFQQENRRRSREIAKTKVGGRFAKEKRRPGGVSFQADAAAF